MDKMIKKDYWETLNKEAPVKIAEAVVKDRDLKLTICQNMVNHGGIFIRALGEAISLADEENLRIFCNSFLKYILRYLPKNWP